MKIEKTGYLDGRIETRKEKCQVCGKWFKDIFDMPRSYEYGKSKMLIHGRKNWTPLRDGGGILVAWEEPLTTDDGDYLSALSRRKKGWYCSVECMEKEEVTEAIAE